MLYPCHVSFDIYSAQKKTFWTTLEHLNVFFSNFKKKKIFSHRNENRLGFTPDFDQKQFFLLLSIFSTKKFAEILKKIFKTYL